MCVKCVACDGTGRHAQVYLCGVSIQGTARRKKKVVHRTASTDDKKLQSTLKKLSVNNIPGVEEVNMIKDDGNVIHFAQPKGTASLHPGPRLPSPRLHSLGFPPASLSVFLSAVVPLLLLRVNFAMIPGRSPCSLVHRRRCVVQAAISANIFAIRGASETKELSEMLPGILNQLGPDSLNSLKKLAQSYGGENRSSLSAPTMFLSV